MAREFARPILAHFEHEHRFTEYECAAVSRCSGLAFDREPVVATGSLFDAIRNLVLAVPGCPFICGSSSRIHEPLGSKTQIAQSRRLTLSFWHF